MFEYILDDPDKGDFFDFDGGHRMLGGTGWGFSFVFNTYGGREVIRVFPASLVEALRLRSWT